MTSFVDLSAKFREQELDLAELGDQPLIDTHWMMWMETVQEVGQNHFAPPLNVDQERKAEKEKVSSERRQLLVRLASSSFFHL